jgi:hypothetical protein
MISLSACRLALTFLDAQRLLDFPVMLLYFPANGARLSGAVC